MKNKIGLGIITCNKPDRLAQSIKTVPGDDYIDCLVIVNDGEPYDSSLYPLMLMLFSMILTSV